MRYSNSNSNSNSNMMRYPFTASQWQELEHQALVFKYMASGIPVPPDLLLRATKFLQLHHTLITSSCSPHIGWRFEMGMGKKMDPEPGRCRRTDGKKWRCSKEAYPDSKYCVRHMHRGRGTGTRDHHHHYRTAAIKTNYFRPPPPPPPPSQLNTNFHSLQPISTMRSFPPGHNESSSVSSSSSSSKLTMASLMSQMKHHDDNNNNTSSNSDKMKDQHQNVMHHNFLDEWSAKTQDSEEDPRRTGLSISIPTSSMHDFFQMNKT